MAAAVSWQLYSDRRTVLAAFAASLLLHWLTVYGWPTQAFAPMRLPLTIEAEFAELPAPPPPSAPEPEPEPPPRMLPKPPMPPPERRTRPTEEVPAPPVRQGYALPVLAADAAQDRGEEEGYTVPEVPPENAELAGAALGTAPASNTGSIYGTPEGSASGSAPPPEPAPAPIDDAMLWQVYGHAVQQQAHRHARYPEVARSRGQQGMVKVAFRVDADGRLRDVVVSQSSGYRVLDEQALRMVHKSLQELPVPPSLRGHAFTIIIPVEFRLR